MTLKSLNKKFALASVALLAASALASVGGGLVFAKTPATTDQVSNGEVAIYAQSAAGNTSTTTANGTGGNDEGVTNNQSGTGQAGNKDNSTPNNGSEQSSLQTAAGKGTMSMVKFSAQVYTGAGAPASADPSLFTGTKVFATTNASGLADFTGLTDGYWIFQQVTTVNGITTVKPFVVYVNKTDSQAGIVNVYPKLDMSSSAGLGDVATTNADDNHNGKTSNEIAAPHVNTDGVTEQNLVNSDGNAGNEAVSNGTWAVGSSKDNQNTTTAASRDTVNWNVNSVFDSSQTSNTDGSVTGTYGTYIIKDQLPDNLVDSSRAADSTVVVNVNDGSGKQVGTLTPTTDYTVTNDSKGAITVTLTPTGQVHVAMILGNADGALNVIIPSTVRDDVYGSAKDSARTTITNAYGADLSTTMPVQSTLNVGALDFQKEDGTSKALLANATFVLVKAKDEAAAKSYVEANASYFNNNADSVTGVAAPAAGTDASFVTDASGNFVTTKTDSNGMGVFTGLNLVDDNTDTINKTNYFAVEVQAPTGGYQLPTPSNGANVFGAETASTTTLAGDGTTNSNIITNTKPFALPFTGGAGIASIIIIAGASGFAAFAIRRRKNNEEEVVR